MLKRDIIVTGNQLVNATTSTGQSGPQVDVTLDSAGGEEMLRTTRANVGKAHGRGVHRAAQRDRSMVDRQAGDHANDQGRKGHQRRDHPGRVRQPLHDHGPHRRPKRARLSLLLRGGALTAPISIANEKTVTGTLGKENIEKGVKALIIGMAALFVFMIIYYQLFGVVANLVLLANVVVLTALLSMLRHRAHAARHRRHHPHRRHGGGRQRADLRTHPRGIAQRRFAAGRDQGGLREGVLRHRGLQRHDVDRGRGAVRVRHRRDQGFAIVLSLGILTSMFTSLMGSRALLTLMYGGKRKLTKLAIG